MTKPKTKLRRAEERVLSAADWFVFTMYTLRGIQFRELVKAVNALRKAREEERK